MPTAPWPWWHQGTGPDDYRIRELLRGIWDLHALYSREAWVWRGQANASFKLEPGMHTRIRGGTVKMSDAWCASRTRAFLDAVREAKLDLHEGVRLPDLALLAMFQHHGAATPLLDVTLDPVLALYMAVVSPSAADDDSDGVLFAIRRPGRTLDPFDSREFPTVYSGLPADEAVLYSAPEVSNRLRNQRGHFLLGKYSDKDSRVAIPLRIEPRGTSPSETWLQAIMNARGRKGVPAAKTDVGVFRIPAKFKTALRKWLESHSGLTREFVFPTAWHQPHIESFAASHGRRSVL